MERMKWKEENIWQETDFIHAFKIKGVKKERR